MRKFLVLSFLSYLSLNCFGFAELIKKFNNMTFEEISDCEFIKSNPNSMNVNSSNSQEYLAARKEFAEKDGGASTRASMRRTVKDSSRSLTYEISKRSFKFLNLPPNKLGFMAFQEPKEEGGRRTLQIKIVEGFDPVRINCDYEIKKRRFSGADPMNSYLIIEREDGTAERIRLYSFNPETGEGAEEIPLKEWRAQSRR